LEALCCNFIERIKNKNAQYGLAAICNGGGVASAMIIKNLSHE
jgi:acetyl-CoA acetyltransferase